MGQRVVVRESCGGEQRTGTLGGQRREGDDEVAGDQSLGHHVSALRQWEPWRTVGNEGSDWVFILQRSLWLQDGNGMGWEWQIDGGNQRRGKGMF